MRFVDECVLTLTAGDGGNGCIAFRREAHVQFGGPSGGDGGRGGSVIFEGDEGRNSLLDLKHLRRIQAERGEHGKGKDKYGKAGRDEVVRVPVGTIVIDQDTSHKLGELLAHGQKLVVAQGGEGGRGNRHFATPVDRAPRKAELVEVPVPQPGPGQVLVRVAGCGLCHSDLTMASMDVAVGEALGWRVPFTLGHETAGWVDAVGTEVDSGAATREGSAVALVSPSSCGSCRWCLRGQENACPNGLVGRGYGRDGGLAEYVVVDDPARSLVALGTLDPRIAGPLTDAGATSHHAVARVLPHLAEDSTVVVIGIGGLGSFVVQILRALAPARIVAVDREPARLDRAAALGADHGVAGVDRETAASVRAIVGLDPVDAVIDVVGTDDTISLGARLLAPGGALAVVGAEGGTLRRPWFGSLPRDGSAFTFQGSDLADVRAVMALAAQNLLSVEVDPYPLASVAEAYAALGQGTLGGRAVIYP